MQVAGAWARSQDKFAGADFTLIDERTLKCPAEKLKFPQGKCVITSPGYSSEGQASIPYPLIIPVSKADEKRAKESENLWDKQVSPALENQVTIPDIQTLTQALYERIEEAGRLLPLPDEDGGTPDVLENFPARIYQNPGF
jgi:hypothetical protein